MKAEPIQKKGYVVLVEWDGKTPPTVWYNRLHEYGLWVRGSKDQSPISRRESSKGVVFQEGAVVVDSQSFARLLAAHAVDMGAKTVSVGLMEIDHYTMSEQDAKAFERITEQKSKRGPKTHSEEGTYTVTCFEEAATYQVELRMKPTTCPNCGGFRIWWHPGKKAHAVAADGDPLKSWLASRFYTGQFEVAEVNPASKHLVVSAPKGHKADPVALKEASRFASVFPAQVTHRAMDIAYCIGLMADDKKARLDRRISTLREYYARGGENQYPMAVPGQIDIVDIAGIDDNFIKYL